MQFFALCSIAAWPLLTTTAQTTNHLGFTDGFEGYPNRTPLINGTNGWYGATLHNTETNVIVQRSVVRSRLQAAIIPFNSVLSNRFETTNRTVWIQADVLPAFFDDMDEAPEVNQSASAEFFINSNGYFVVHDGPASPSPTASTNWITLTQLQVESNAWVRVHIKLDYDARQWDLYADYNELMTGIAFVSNVPSFRGFGIYNGGDATNYSGIMTTYVDNVSVQADRVPPDLALAPTVMTNQVFRGRDAPSQTFTASSASAEFWPLTCSPAAGTNWIDPGPVSFVLTNDAPQTITNRYPTSTLAGGTHTGEVFVSTPNAWGTTQSVSVVMHVMEFATSPTQLTAVTQFSISPPSQDLEVWNAGGGLMEYTAATNVPWLRVLPVSGASENGAHNTHTVSFNTESLELGVHTGHIILASSTGSGETQRVSVVITVVPFPQLMVSPTLIEVETQRGFNASNKTYEVWRGGDYCTLAYTSTPHLDSTWLAVNPQTGTSAGEHDQITISFDTATMAGGVYTGKITVAGSITEFGLNAGGSPKTISVVLRVRQLGDDVTQRIWASQGTHADKVAVGWDAVRGAAYYEVWESSTFDIDFAQKVATVVGLSWEDISGVPATAYYYWVRPMSALNFEGVWSSNAVGWRALSPPLELTASKGAYVDRVRVAWTGSENAESYDVWRQTGARTGAPDTTKAVMVMHTTQTAFEDVQALPGETYTYWVRARKPDFVSGFSDPDQGYVLKPPLSVTASDGTYLDRVRISWRGVTGASSYQIWRAPDDNTENAALITQVPASGAADAAMSYDDTGAEIGKTYTYWMKSANSSGATVFSSPDRGFRAIGNANMKVSDVVFLPGALAPGERASIVSYRVKNQGVYGMQSPDAKVREEIYASPADASGAEAKATWLLSVREYDLALAVGEETGITVPAENLPHMNVGGLGLYNIYVHVAHCPPSRLGDSNPQDNTAQRSEPVEVRAKPGVPYFAVNDFNGNGRSDLAVYNPLTALWFIRCITGELLVWGEAWGGSGFMPVMGDYDGDRRADLVVYQNALGAWYGKSSTGNLLMWALAWGGPGLVPVFGDYDGDGRADLAVYRESDGTWFITTMTGSIMAWAAPFGGPGFRPVPGDYDGNGAWDMAVYDINAGKWYGRNPSGELTHWAESWGGGFFVPVPGDYNGDGKWDMAVYNPINGAWFIRGALGELIAWDVPWGGWGFEPVSGDFDGDGKWDMAVYAPASGAWFIRAVNGTVLSWGSLWGGSNFTPLPKAE